MHKEPILPLYISDWREHPPAIQNELFESLFLEESTYRSKWDEPQLVHIHVQILSDNRFRYNLSFHNRHSTRGAPLQYTELFRLHSAHKAGIPINETKTDRLFAH